MPRLRDILYKPARFVPLSVVGLDGETKLDFAIRLLDSGHTRDAHTRARAYAKQYGVPDPREDDVLYLRGLWANTLLLACVDPDSSPESPVPYFDDVEQIERMLDDARIAFVFQAWRDHQIEYAPAAGDMPPEEVVKLTLASADEWRAGGDPDRPFVGLPSRTLRSFSAQLALRFSALTEMLSRYGSQNPDAGRTSATSAPSAGEPG